MASMRTNSLRLIPVLSATASLTFAASEFLTLIPFLQPNIPSKTLSRWFGRWLWYGVPTVLTFGAASVGGGYWSWRRSYGGARVLYGYGTLFAAGHFLFRPTVQRCISRLVHGPTDAKDELRWWLKLHAARTVIMDIPAAICFVGAFLHAV